MAKESMTLRCRMAVVAHPGLTAHELAEAARIEYRVLERRLPDLRRKGLVTNGDERTCRVVNTNCKTWFPVAPGSDEYFKNRWPGPETLPSEREPVDPALIAPPDPEYVRLLEQGPLHRWITRELIEDTKRVWSPSYGYALPDSEAVEILMNVRRYAELWLKWRAGEFSKTDSPSPAQSPTPPLDYSI